MTVTLPWKTWLVAGAIIALAVFMLNRTHKQLNSALRDAEAAQLALKDQTVAFQESKDKLQSDVKDLTDASELLKQAYEEALKAAPGAKPVGEARLDTGPLALRTPPRPAPQPVKSAGGAGETQAAATAQPVLPPAGPSSVCALDQSDKISIEVEVLDLGTKAGNFLVVGTASAYRLTPVKSLLTEGKFQSSLSSAHSLETPPPLRWGARASLGWLPQGRVQGGGVALPPFNLLGVRLEPSAAILGGATFVGIFDVVARF